MCVSGRLQSTIVANYDDNTAVIQHNNLLVTCPLTFFLVYLSSLFYLSSFFLSFSFVVLLFPMCIFHNPQFFFFPCLPLPKVEQKVESPPSAIPLVFTYLKLMCLSRVSYVIRLWSHPFISPKSNILLLSEAVIDSSNSWQFHLDLSPIYLV